MKVAAVALGILTGAGPASAQDAASILLRADSQYSRRNVKEAHALFLEALKVAPRNHEALWKASRTEVDIAESAQKGQGMDSLLAAARTHAEMAVEANPRDAEGHFALARALGRKALAVGTMDRIRFSKIIHAEATETLRLDSLHAGGLHVMGMWHAEIMRVNGFARAFAKTFLGAQVFSKANWESAERFLETAVRVDPRRIVHQLDLAGIYMDRDKKDKARELYEAIAKAPVVEPNDDLYQRQAAERLRKL